MVAANATTENNVRFIPLFLKIKNAMRGARAIACGFVKSAIARVTAESSGLDFKRKY